MNSQNIKKNVSNTLRYNGNGDFTEQSRIFDSIIGLLILFEVIIFCVMSLNNIPDWFIKFSYFTQIFVFIIFTVEYILRVYVSTLHADHNVSKFWTAIKYMSTPLAVLDLIAITPFIINIFIETNNMMISGLRFVIVFRFFRLASYFKSLQLIKTVIKEKLNILVSAIFLMIGIVLMSSIYMYYLEKDVQPELFTSIPQTFWWSIVTLTTVGYGDMYPITVPGQILASIVAIAGIGIVALPTSIISSGFIEIIEREKRKKEKHEVIESTTYMCECCNKEMTVKRRITEEI